MRHVICKVIKLTNRCSGVKSTIFASNLYGWKYKVEENENTLAKYMYFKLVLKHSTWVNILSPIHYRINMRYLNSWT